MDRGGRLLRPLLQCRGEDARRCRGPSGTPGRADRDQRLLPARVDGQGVAHVVALQPGHGDVAAQGYYRGNGAGGGEGRVRGVRDI